MTLGRHADFNRLWAGQTASNFGDKISVLALPTIAVVVLGGGAFEVGLLGALRFVPFFVFAPIVGIVADRFPRRSIMIAADVGRLLALASIPVAFMFDGLTIAQLYVVAGATGILTTFFEISYQSYLPSLIGRENLVEGNTKLQVSRSLAEVAGAGIGGALMQFFGAARAIALDAVTYVVSLVCLLTIKHREDREELRANHANALEDMKEGFRTLFGTSTLRGLFFSSSIVNLGAAMGDALLLVYAYTVLGLSPGQVGIAAAVGAAFVIVGAILSSKVVEVFTLGRTLVLTAVVLGAGYALLPYAGVALAFAGLIIIQAVIGFVSPMYDIHVLTLVQNVTPNKLMGRVSGTALAAVYGALGLGYSIGGTVGEFAGLTTGLLLAGTVAALGGLTLLASPVAAMRAHPAQAEDETDEEEPREGGEALVPGSRATE